VPSNGADDQTRIATEAKAWELRQRGWTQSRIARELGLDQGTICRMLGRIERRELKRLSKRVQSEKARQTAILEHIADEALQAWELSKRPKRRASTRKSALGSVDVTEMEEREGEPAYLDRAQAALDRLRQLWGLNAPAKKPDENQGLTYSALAQRLTENGAAHDALVEAEPEQEAEPT
jgi:DNA-binding MarR family transcriptional regulator